jgi:hypothetical protein
MFGQAVKLLERAKLTSDGQKCVCFTETPIEHIHLLLHDIEDRQVRFEPYGIAITKRIGRKKGVNPVWYLDMTPGHEFLTNPLNRLIQREIDATTFEGSDISELAPFVEQMGHGARAGGGGGFKKEFWWEREWRHTGNLNLPSRYVVLCPVAEKARFKRVFREQGLEEDEQPSFIDPRWSLEQIVAKLAGFNDDEIDVI